MADLRNLSTAIRLLKHLRREKKQPRITSVVGLIGRAESDIAAEGAIFVRGELWPAHADATIASGEKIRVIGLNRDGLFLVVEHFTS